MRRALFSLLCLCLGLQAGEVLASGPEVVAVTVGGSSQDSRRDFHVTVRHEDSGWEHYAERFEILSDDETVLGVRILAHPHVDEQPFTRSALQVEIGSGRKSVLVRARDNKGTYGPAFRLDLSGK